MAELLVELLSEEIPARMQAPAAAELARLLADRLAKAGLAFAEPRTFSTPRRIAVAVDGLPLRQADSREEKRGPRADAPEAAVQGFLRANGLTLDRCERRETARGVFWFAVVERPGRAAAEVLPECLAEAVAGAIAEPAAGVGHLYELGDPIREKVEKLARNVYGAETITWQRRAELNLRRARRLGQEEWPICVAKTQYSLSDDPSRLGRPTGHEFTVRELRPSAGAGFVVVISGEIMTMPGLPRVPAAARFRVGEAIGAD